MKLLNMKYALTLLLVGVFLLPNSTFAQDQKGHTKVVITKKTIDKDGNEIVEKIVHEGKDIDVDELIKTAESEEGNVEIDVEVTMDGEEPSKKSGEQREIKVTVDGGQVKIMDGDKVDVFEIGEGDGTQEIKTEDGKHVVIKMKSADGNEVAIGEIIEHINVDVTEDGNKIIKIVSTNGPAPDENGAFLGVMIGSDTDVLTIDGTVEGSPAEKAGLQKGDIIHIVSGSKIPSYKVLTEVLSKFKPNDTIEILYDRDGKYNTVKTTLVRRGDVAETKKMMWKTEDGEEIELHEDKDGKVKKEKIIIKKKIKKEKE